MNRMELASIYAGAKPETPRPVRPMAIVHRATGESAVAIAPKPAPKPAAKPAKPAAKPARKLSGPRYRIERVEDTK